MSKAVTVRRIDTGELVCFGPDNGMYDPGVPPGCVKAIEPDYDTIKAQELAKPRVDKLATLMADSRVPQWFKDWIS